VAEAATTKPGSTIREKSAVAIPTCFARFLTSGDLGKQGMGSNYSETLLRNL
jgi:hypothetical protein